MRKVILVVAALGVVAAITLSQGYVLMIFLGIVWGEFQVGAPVGLLAAWGLVTLGQAVLSYAATAFRKPPTDSVKDTLKALEEYRISKDAILN